MVLENNYNRMMRLDKEVKEQKRSIEELETTILKLNMKYKMLKDEYNSFKQILFLVITVYCVIRIIKY